MTKSIADKLGSQVYARYTASTDQEAVRIAHEDLLIAPDHEGGLPVSSYSNPYICKMYATDVLRRVAQWFPLLITETIIRDCQRMFSKCNAASRLNVVIIIGLLRRTDALPFLDQVQLDPKNSGLVSGAAAEAIQVIRGIREIGFGFDPMRHITTYSPDNARPGC